LEEVAERIASSGVRHLKEVIYDDSYFDNVVPSSWEWGDLQTDDVRQMLFVMW
jgi:D-alanyl-D-alanine carboxypeptidase